MNVDRAACKPEVEMHGNWPRVAAWVVARSQVTGSLRTRVARNTLEMKEHAGRRVNPKPASADVRIR